MICVKIKPKYLQNIHLIMDQICPAVAYLKVVTLLSFDVYVTKYELRHLLNSFGGYFFLVLVFIK